MQNGEFSLQIENAGPQDAGDYICQIATLEPLEITHTVEILGKSLMRKVSLVSINLFFSSLVPPRIHHISSGSHLQIEKGGAVKIECAASGNPTPNITWARKNNVLPSGKKKRNTKRETFKINNLSLLQVMKYCVRQFYR